MVERRIDTTKNMSTRVFDELNIVGIDAAAVALRSIGSAINTLAHRPGFSPRQWVLGYQPHLPGSLIDGETTLGEHEAATREGSPFWHRLRLLEAAHSAYHRTDNEMRLRRAVLAGARPTPGPFQAGGPVYYYRMRGLKRNLHQRWHGPARIIGADGSNFWLIHNGIPILASARLLRLASAEEVRSWKGIGALPDLAPQESGKGGCFAQPQGPRGFFDIRGETFEELPGPIQDGEIQSTHKNLTRGLETAPQNQLPGGSEDPATLPEAEPEASAAPETAAEEPPGLFQAGEIQSTHKNLTRGLEIGS